MGDQRLLPCLGVHEVVQVTVIVGVLHILALDVRVLEFIGGVKGALGHCARHDVLHLGTDESCALSGLDVLELDDLIHVTVHVERQTVSEIACYYHYFIPPDFCIPTSPPGDTICNYTLLYTIFAFLTRGKTGFLKFFSRRRRAFLVASLPCL